MELGVRHILLAVIAGFAVWSLYALYAILAISLAILMVLIAVGLRLRRHRPAGGVEGDDEALALAAAPEKTDLRMAAAVVIAFLVTAGGLIAGTDYMCYLQSSIDYSYGLTIESPSSEAFTVICPVPCKADGSICEQFFAEARIVEGSGSISRADTEHGHAIRILGEGTVRLEWRDSWSIDGDRYPNMTMTWEIDDSAESEYYDYDVTAESWVSSNSDNTHILLSYDMRSNQEAPGLFNPSSERSYMFEVVTQGMGWETVGVDYHLALAD